MDNIEGKISKMESAFENLLNKLDNKESSKNEKKFKKKCIEKDKIIEKQKQQIKVDDQVKQEMAIRLQKVLLDNHDSKNELENAKREIARLRTFQTQLLQNNRVRRRRRSNKSIWSLFGFDN